MIASLAEARTYLGLNGAISDSDLGLLNLVHAGAHAAVRKYLRYDPEYKSERTEYYPRLDDRPRDGAGVWDSDGAKAYWKPAASDQGDVLIVQHLPLRQVRQIYLDENARFGTAPGGAWPASSLLVEGTDFYPEYEQSGVCLSGSIRKVAGGWPSTPGSLKVVYECGYTSEELNGEAGVFDARSLKEGVLLSCERAFKTRKLQQKQTRAGWVAGALTSEKLGSYSYSTDGQSSRFFSLAAYLTPETKECLDPYRHYGMMLL